MAGYIYIYIYLIDTFTHLADTDTLTEYFNEYIGILIEKQMDTPESKTG